MQSILVALTVVGTSAAFAQEKMSPEPAGPVAEAAIQLSSEEEERLLIQKLEQIENDPFVREKAKAEAEVPLSVF
jgi:hypothetical protein